MRPRLRRGPSLHERELRLHRRRSNDVRRRVRDHEQRSAELRQVRQRVRRRTIMRQRRVQLSFGHSELQRTMSFARRRSTKLRRVRARLRRRDSVLSGRDLRRHVFSTKPRVRAELRERKHGPVQLRRLQRRLRRRAELQRREVRVSRGLRELQRAVSRSQF